MKDQPNQRPEHSDSWDRTVFIFRRYSRQLLGLLLMCIVGGIIYYVAVINPKEPTTGSRWSANQKKTSPDDSPLESQGSPYPSDSQDAPSQDNPQIDEPNLDSTDASSSTTPSQTKTVGQSRDTIDKYLSESSSSELVEEILNLRNQKSPSLPVNFVTVQRRAKIGKYLITLDEATPEQKVFATNDYIESIILLDAINQNAGLNADHVREELIAIGEDFSDHADDLIGSKASLAYVLVPIHDFSGNKQDPTVLQKTADQFDIHADKIIRNPDTMARFAKLIVDIYRESDYSDQHRNVAMQIMKRIEKENNPKIQTIVSLLREQIYFAKSELGSLVDRIEGGNELARGDVQALFEGLDANPTSRTEIYKVATNVIAEYARLGREEDAGALTTWLISINEKNTSDNQAQISKAIAQFEKTKADKK